MSQQAANSDVETRDPVHAKIITQINEDRLSKEITSTQLSRFKLLDELAQEIQGSSKKEELVKILDENLAESPQSLASRYTLGILGLKEGSDERISHLRNLLDVFKKAAKWTIVDHIADQILAVEEKSRFALRAKVESTERLRGKKELGPYLERLVAIDRKNPEIVHKYALSILEEDRDRSIEHLKSAADQYARQKDYKNLEDIWDLLVKYDYNDLAFFEKIERTLVGNREKTRIAAYLMNLSEPLKNDENWPAAIKILKKILEYEPTSTRARTDIIRAYRMQHENHSLLEEFLKLSDLTNNRKAVGPCIANFERNIVFDQGNYVYHRSRGVGKIQSINSEEVIIDFEGNEGQKMTIQMAISSLQPLGQDHIWVQYYENPDIVRELFESDIIEFFRILLVSFGGSMVLAEIKQEVTPRFLEPDQWSKWWSKTRGQLKKDDKFGFNPKKKDELILRENPITLSEELQARFQQEGDWTKKLELSLESLKDRESEDAMASFALYYVDQEHNRDPLKRVQSYLFVELAKDTDEDLEIEHQASRQEVQALFIKEKPSTLVKWCADTTSQELKKEIVSLVIETRKDYPEILGEILFETPIKINRQVISELNRLGQTETLASFLKKAFSRYREHPEIFLWAARSILTGQWNYEWISYSRKDILLLIFRLLKPLAQIEKKGTRLKNSALEAIFGTTNITVESIKNSVLAEIIPDADPATIRRMAALFRDVPYLPDAHKENLNTYLEEARPEYSRESFAEEPSDDTEEEQPQEESLFPEAGIIMVTEKGLEDRKSYLDHLINVEMPENSNDINVAKEKGDLRENAEYKAALEKQQTLQAEITKISNDLKSTRIIEPANVRTDLVAIGSKVEVKNQSGEVSSFSILGPWEADAENNIISYVSPLGKALIGKKVGESATTGSETIYTVTAIKSAFS